MDISEKQLEANRANAKLGGVKTADGKEVSKMNALKHGLLCGQVLLESEEGERATLAEFEARMREQLIPVGELENLLVDRIIANIWRLKRLIKIESSAMEYENNNSSLAFDLMDGERQLERKRTANMLRSDTAEKIIRYEATLERGIYKALHELQRIQSVRNGEKVPLPTVLDVDISSKTG